MVRPSVLSSATFERLHPLPFFELLWHELTNLSIVSKLAHFRHERMLNMTPKITIPAVKITSDATAAAAATGGTGGTLVGGYASTCSLPLLPDPQDADKTTSVNTPVKLTPEPCLSLTQKKSAHKKNLALDPIDSALFPTPPSVEEDAVAIMSCSEEEEAAAELGAFLLDAVDWL